MPAVTPFKLDVARIKNDFPILTKAPPGRERLVFLDSAASTQKPRSVIQAMVDCFENYYANVHRGIYSFSETSTERYEAARSTVAQFLNAQDPQSIIFTGGCTAAVNTIARSWGDANVQPGDLMIATEMEHHANLVPWFQLAQRKSAKTQLVGVTPDGLLDLTALSAALEQKPKLVAVTAVSNVLGTINPIAEIVSMCHTAGAIVVVDAAQAAPHQAVDVQQWNADFVVVSGHKILGPNGIGILYGKLEHLEAMPPFMGGGGMISRVWNDGFSCADLPAKFEAGTPPITEAIGLAAAIDYLQEIGLDKVSQHEQYLTQIAHQRLNQIEGLKIWGPSPEHKGGIVSFTLAKVHAHDIAYLLDQKGVAVRAGHHCTMPLHKRLGIAASTRASFYIYNDEDDVEALAEALEGLQARFQRKK